ncbi:hypothetical protein Y032_0754g2064 [Ancylostoma ceylanicum]|uniref:Mos1 transposase HTH domain-containing protein n=1 Tax=Ancylostoma ceylanicum TaxID=53326 RepID=A0A016WG20_9BILA|nr:hypothetical protein Y032_0754g2064 [Ancylostoma ceylanicum]
MDLKEKVYRANPLLQYRRGSTADEAHRFLLDFMDDQAPSRTTCFIWYRKFRRIMYEASRIGRPPTQKRSVVIATCEAQPDHSVRDVAARTQTSKSTIHDVLRTSDKVPKLPRVLPHVLSTWDKKRCVEVYFPPQPPSYVCFDRFNSHHG